MSDLLVIVFDSTDAAARMAEALNPERESLQMELQDITVITRDEGGRIAAHEPVNVLAAQTLGGVGWGLVIGAAFLMPVAGAVAGAAAGAAVGMMRDPNIDRDFLKRIGETLKPGGSALCLLVRRMEPEALMNRVRAEGLSGELITSPLPEAEEKRLRAALAAAS